MKEIESIWKQLDGTTKRITANDKQSSEAAILKILKRENTRKKIYRFR